MSARDDREMASVAGLKAEGWTDGLIRRWLGEPDKLAPNPHYSRAGAPMKLYDLARVKRTMRRKAVRQDLAEAEEKRAGRRTAANRAVETKTALLIAEIDALDIVVERKPWADVVRAAMGSAVSRNGEWRQMAHESEAALEDRMVWNYLRHECTNYHAGLNSLAARVGGSGPAYYRLRERVDEAILDAYSELRAG